MARPKKIKATEAVAENVAPVKTDKVKTEDKKVAENKDVKDVVKEQAVAVTKTVEKKATAAAKAVKKEVASAAKAVKKEVADKAAKAAAKKETEVKVMVQQGGLEYDMDAIVEKAKAAWVAKGHRVSSIKQLSVYVNIDEKQYYTVINGEEQGGASLQ